MFRRSKKSALKANAASASDFASSLAKDKKFRKELLSAISHGTVAQRRAARDRAAGIAAPASTHGVGA